MRLSTEFILEEHLRKITPLIYCALCRSSLRGVAVADRGIIEFHDGFFWICPACRKKIPDSDQTQHVPWARTPFPRYSRRSRRSWLQWFRDEYGVDFGPYWAKAKK